MILIMFTIVEKLDALEIKTQELEQRMADMQKRFNKTKELEQRVELKKEPAKARLELSTF